MPTIIDTLIVKLGLDSKDLDSKGAAGVKRLKELEGANSKVAKSTKEASESVKELGRNLTSFFAILGGGYALKAFIEDTIASNAALERLSKNLGISVNDLSAWGNAVEELGGSAKGLQGTMSMLSQSQTELRYTGQSSLLPYFASLNIALSTVDGKARPVNDILLDLAERFSHLDQPTANNLGKMMGIDQDTLNLLHQGRTEVELMIKRQKEFNAVSKAQAEESVKLQRSIIGLKQSFAALGRDLLQQASPAIERMLSVLSELASWVQSNKQFIKDLAIILGAVAAGLTLISIASSPITLTVVAIGLLAAAIAALWQDYQNWKRGGDSFIDWEKWKPGIDSATAAIKSLAKVVKESFGAIFNDVQAVQKLMNGDWRGALGSARKSDDNVRSALGDAWHAVTGVVHGVAASGGSKSPTLSKAQSGTAQRIRKYFEDRGWSPEQASGITANLMAESNGDPNATGDSGRAFGLAQWHSDRQAAFKVYKGRDIRGSSLDDQLDFVNHELQRRGGAQLHAAKTAAEAGAIVSRVYEGPKDKDGEAYRRGLLSQQINGIPGASAQVAQAGRTGGNSSTSNDHSTTVNVHGNTIINSQATDAQGIARDWLKSFNYAFTAQAASGLN